MKFLQDKILATLGAFALISGVQGVNIRRNARRSVSFDTASADGIFNMNDSEESSDSKVHSAHAASSRTETNTHADRPEMNRQYEYRRSIVSPVEEETETPVVEKKAFDDSTSTADSLNTHSDRRKQYEHRRSIVSPLVDIEETEEVEAPVVEKKAFDDTDVLDESTSMSDPLLSVMPLATADDDLLTADDNLIAAEDKPLMTENKLVAAQEIPLVATVEDKPLITEDKLVAAEDKPLITENKLVAAEQEKEAQIYDALEKLYQETLERYNTKFQASQYASDPDFSVIFENDKSAPAQKPIVPEHNQEPTSNPEILADRMQEAPINDIDCVEAVNQLLNSEDEDFVRVNDEQLPPSTDNLDAPTMETTCEIDLLEEIVDGLKINPTEDETTSAPAHPGVSEDGTSNPAATPTVSIRKVWRVMPAAEKKPLSEVISVELKGLICLPVTLNGLVPYLPMLFKDESFITALKAFMKYPAVDPANYLLDAFDVHTKTNIDQPINKNSEIITNYFDRYAISLCTIMGYKEFKSHITALRDLLQAAETVAAVETYTTTYTNIGTAFLTAIREYLHAIIVNEGFHKTFDLVSQMSTGVVPDLQSIAHERNKFREHNVINDVTLYNRKNSLVIADCYVPLYFGAEYQAIFEADADDKFDKAFDEWISAVKQLSD